LLAAYGCEPFRGSESAVGWNWALQMSRYFEVTVVTRKSRKAAIEKFLDGDPSLRENLVFEYVDYPGWVVKLKRGGVTMNLYYLAWLGLAFFRSRRLVKEKGIELAHHVSFMSITRGAYVPFLKVPSIVGPVGGLQTIPPAYREVSRSPIIEKIRSLGVRYFRLNPLGRLAVSNADLVVLANSTNSGALPEKVLAKTVVGQQIGTDAVPARELEVDPEKFVFRWIGRLIDHKGLEILIDVISLLKEIEPEIFSKIQIIVSGSGPLAAYYRKLIREREIETTFEFVEWLSEEEMNSIWNRSRAFLFTSLRETTGLALLEAMTRGVPPVIIDNGGPSEIVTDETGYKISAPTYPELLRKYAETMVRCVRDPDHLELLGLRARERAIAHYSWEAVGLKMKTFYHRVLEGLPPETSSEK